jgi:hypothetical protein
MMLPSYVDAYGNERHWAQDRGHFAARPFGGAEGPVVFGTLGAVDASFGAAVSIASLLNAGLAPSAELLASFQRMVGISADGVYGPQTRDALARVLRATPEGTAMANRLPSVAPSGGGGGGGGGGATAQPGARLVSSPGFFASLPDWAPWAIGAVAAGTAIGLVAWKLKKKRGRR